ncbi:Tricorn protease-like protein [Sulfidibacter corallicola]|uniref:Tricorn protease homolog n=1 Tax=Sulfidibacter corallicola TaxID=2818388 RepID=A0A8A4TWT8_SULCO|nr:S41 family peptidase [Sulfidibacter corallicola]QTD53432.1 PD40 domain-containing protein [Sulfidibacter corallicola]
MYTIHSRVFRLFEIASWLCFLVSSPALCGTDPVQGPFLFQGVALNRTHLFFGLAGRIWRVPRAGGVAISLTDGDDRYPVVAPDGRFLAFYRRADRNAYLLDLTNGEVRQVTFHPGPDIPVAFSPDGRTLLFASQRDKSRVIRLYRLNLEKAWPEPLPFPFGTQAAFSPDGASLVLVPIGRMPFTTTYRRYRGGRRPQLVQTDTRTFGTYRPLTDGFNAFRPIWLAHGLFFLSDRDGISNLYRLDPDSGQIHRVTRFSRMGIRFAAGFEDHLAYCRDGALYVSRAGTIPEEPLSIRVPLDFRHRRTKTVNALELAKRPQLARSADRIVLEGRGDLFAIETATGHATNLTRSSERLEREPAISDDGRFLAFFCSLASGDLLCIRDLSRPNQDAVRSIEVEGSFYRGLHWAPGGKRLCFTGPRGVLWLYDLEADRLRAVDHARDPAQVDFQVSWSPDGRWFAYVKWESNRLAAVYVHDTDTETGQRISPTHHYAVSPAFDPNGRYLYFLSSPQAPGSDVPWSLQSAIENQPRILFDLHAAILRRGDSEPVWFLSGLPNLEAKWEASKEPVQIDFDGIETRLVSLPRVGVQPRRVRVLRSGHLILSGIRWKEGGNPFREPSRELFHLNLRDPGKIRRIAGHVRDWHLTPGGSALVFRQKDRIYVARFEAGRFVRQRIPTHALPVRIDQKTEWTQIFEETWRAFETFFYDPNVHGFARGPTFPGLNRRFEKYLPNITTRGELNDLMARMFDMVSVSHLNVGGGDLPPSVPTPQVGLLGADFAVDRGTYRFTKIYRRPLLDSFQDPIHAPLDRPGARVAVGDYLLAVDGKPVNASRNLYAYFEGKVRRPVELTVGPDPSGRDSRRIRVEPLRDEGLLRLADWAASNRRRVEKASRGALVYQHVARFDERGLQDFIRAYYASHGARGLILDIRFNPGGITFDRAIEMLERERIYAYRFRGRDGLNVPPSLASPTKVLIVNQWNGSAAETFALMFRLTELGTIVGRATIGAGIAAHGLQPHSIDGGVLEIPSRAAFNPETGTWSIENVGIQPDIDIGLDPFLWRQGRDSQLERAIAGALNRSGDLQASPRRMPSFPDFNPDKHQTEAQRQ